MFLVESFLSIQGEGKWAGKLAFFLRFVGCNLECKGFGVKKISPKNGEILVGCDTIKAVKTSHFEYKNIDLNSLVNLIENLSTLIQKPIIVITGGEPLLHHKNSDFLEFVKWLLESKFEVHFETNGTIFIDFNKFHWYKNCKFCVSPKLFFSEEKYKKRLNFKALKAIFENSESFLKFVIKDESQLDEISEIISKIGINDLEIYCMPLGKDAIELEQNAQKVAQFCIKNGFCYSDRLHIRLWNDKEGV